VVLRHYGDWRCQPPSRRNSLSSAVALLALRHFLRLKRNSVFSRLCCVVPQIHTIPRALGSHDQGCHQLTISRNNADRICYLGGVLDPPLRPLLGSLGDDLCLGAVDDRCHRRSGHQSLLRHTHVCIRMPRKSSTPPPGLRSSSISSDYQTSLDRITAAQLLPIAATVVAAGAGGEIAEVLPNPQHALGTLITSYVMWGVGVPLALTVLVMYYQRLALHKLPPREVIVSCFLPLGPLGMGGYTILVLGKVSRENFVRTHVVSDVAGEVVYVFGFFVALIMWGFGLVWLAFALATIYKCKPFPFNMGWWGFTFPLGVYALCTISIGVEMPSQFFKILGIVSAPS
jgi:hypothetical protein